MGGAGRCPYWKYQERIMEHDLPKKLPVTTVPKAGRAYFNLGTWASYEAARRGEIPTIRIGRKLFVPISAMKRRLEAV